jgi:hypothetical protein
MNNGKWDFLKNMATKIQIRSKYTFLFINILSQNVANMGTISNVTDIVIIFENNTNDIHYAS